MFLLCLYWLCLYFHLYIGHAPLGYATMGKSLYIVVQWSTKEKCYMCTFCKNSCYRLCLLTESLNQSQGTQGTTWDHLPNPVILKPSCTTECLENLLKTLLPGLYLRPTESISSGRGVRHRNTYLQQLSQVILMPVQNSPCRSIYFFTFKLKNITLKSHEPDKTLTYIQRYLQKYIWNLSQQQILLFNKLFFRILYFISHINPWHCRKSLFLAPCLLLLLTLLLFCAATEANVESRLCHRYTFFSFFLVPCSIFSLTPDSKVSMLGMFYWFYFSQ